MSGSHFKGPLYIIKADGSYAQFVDESGVIVADITAPAGSISATELASTLDLSSKTVTLPVLGTTAILSTSATAFAVGRLGATTPALNVDASAATAVTGLNIKSAAAAGGLALTVISSGTNENLTLNAKGSGTIGIGTVSTGAITLGAATTVNAAFTSNGIVRAAAGEPVQAGGGPLSSVLLSSTANFGIYCGSGAPTVSAAKGSIYLRTDGSTTNDRIYVNSSGSTTWVAITTAS